MTEGSRATFGSLGTPGSLAIAGSRAGLLSAAARGTRGRVAGRTGADGARSTDAEAIAAGLRGAGRVRKFFKPLNNPATRASVQTLNAAPAILLLTSEHSQVLPGARKAGYE
jgi:hypothetical protein